MDSKLKRLTILAAFSVILLTFLLVLLLNPGGSRQTTAKPADAQTSEQAQQDNGSVYQNGQIGNDLSAF